MVRGGRNESYPIDSCQYFERHWPITVKAFGDSANKKSTNYLTIMTRRKNLLKTLWQKEKMLIRTFLQSSIAVSCLHQGNGCFEIPRQVLRIVCDNLANIFHCSLNSKSFYAPASKDREHIVLPMSVCQSVRQSVRPSVCLHKLNMKT